MATTNNTYTPGNASLANGNAYEAQLQEVERELARQQADPTSRQAYTNEELQQLYGNVLSGITNGQYNSSTGYYTQVEGSTSQPSGTGQDGWELVQSAQRPVQEGTAGADETFMSDNDYAVLQAIKQKFAAAQAAGDREAMEAAHQEAERLRARYGYSGGGDGSYYLTFGQLGLDSGNNNTNTGGNYSSGTGTTTPDTTAKMDELRNLLEQWKTTATEQKQGQIDYAVQQAVTELERAMADAQPQFKEQAEAVAKDEMQGLDNSALYAETRGDKGGIGQSQYNEIQAAAAQNKLAVQQAQTKLSTDTARQIADLRAQGEFEKADAALEVSQTYLAQLLSLEQWAAEYNLSVAQFEASLQQWQAEYDLAMKQFEVDTDLSYAQLTGQLSDGTLTLNGQSQLASMGEALLSSGIMPNAEQLAAMGLTENQASQYLMAAQLSTASSSGGSSASSSSKTASTEDTSELSTQEALDALFAEAWASGNASAHLTNTNAYKEYGLSSKTGLENQYETWLRQQQAKPTSPYSVSLSSVVQQMREQMMEYGRTPTAIVAMLRQQGYNDAAIDTVLAQLGQ